jgi:hypothetical protein
VFRYVGLAELLGAGEGSCCETLQKQICSLQAQLLVLNNAWDREKDIISIQQKTITELREAVVAARFDFDQAKQRSIIVDNYSRTVEEENGRLRGSVREAHVLLTGVYELATRFGHEAQVLKSEIERLRVDAAQWEQRR